MRLTTVYMIAWLLFCCAVPLQAQEDDTANVLTAAEEAYRIGRIEEARDMLENRVQNLESTLRLRGYRLLSLCCLALDQPQQARSYVELMLGEDPYYTPTVDYPPRFMDMVDEIKRGITATITTASSQAESLSEVPVPTTLITEEMIRNCGGTNLQEVLAAYVPGMHIIDSNSDINIALRGIYSNGQEKILILLNGHRLNSYTTNVAAPDFSISMEKIRQIEVLRGPASSIYGGVALTAVVNIITKQGGDVDGLKVKAGVGNHGQMRGDLLFGKRYFDVDLLVWGSAYKNDGDSRVLSKRDDGVNIPGREVVVGRVGDNPSYDFGLKLNWRGLQVLFNTHFSQVVPPLGASTLAVAYDHSKYRTYKGYFPSFATSSQHLDLNYTRQLGKLNLIGRLTYDQSDITRYQVIHDFPMRQLSHLFPIDSAYSYIFTEWGGLSRYINAQEKDVGARIKGDYTYANSGAHKGAVTFGAAWNRFQLHDFCYQYGYGFTETLPEHTWLRERAKGHEISADAFVQLKHKWRSLILNAGLRYDYKRRVDAANLDVLSPRVALILSRPKWNMRLSYSKSFVDAPYLYRVLNQFDEMQAAETGGKETEDTEAETLSPERVHSWQLSFGGTEWVKGLNFELNAFYNHAVDLIVTQAYDYANGGENKTAGLELMASYRNRKLSVDFNLSWIRTFKSNLVKASGEEGGAFSALFDNTLVDANNNTPAIMSNAVVAWQVAKPLKLSAHLLFEGRQTSYNIEALKLINSYNVMEQFVAAQRRGDEDEMMGLMFDFMNILEHVMSHDEMPARLICNVGAEYQLGRHLTLGLNVRNLFNTGYDRSGMSTKLIPQRGRWWMLTAAWQF